MKKEKESPANTLLKKVDALTKSGEEMGKEITRLKSVIGGYRTSNTNYAKKIDELKNQLGVERNRVGVLYNENKELQEKNKDLTDKVTDLTVDRDKYKAMYDDYISLSWWQRLFL